MNTHERGETFVDFSILQSNAFAVNCADVHHPNYYCFNLHAVSVQCLSPADESRRIHPSQNKSKSSFDCSSRKKTKQSEEKKQHRLQASNRTRKERSLLLSRSKKITSWCEKFEMKHTRARKIVCASAPKARGKELKQLFHFGSLDLSSIFFFHHWTKQEKLDGKQREKN